MHLKSNKELLLKPTTTKVLTFHPLSTTEESDDERGENLIDVTLGVERIARVDTTSHADLSLAGWESFMPFSRQFYEIIPKFSFAFEGWRSLWMFEWWMRSRESRVFLMMIWDQVEKMTMRFSC